MPKLAPATPGPTTPAAPTACLAEPSDDECDLQDPADCVRYILSRFPLSEREGAKPAASYFVNELKSKATKKDSLFQLMQMKIVKSGVLKTHQSRQKWLSAEKYNRALRYVKKRKGSCCCLWEAWCRFRYPVAAIPCRKNL